MNGNRMNQNQHINHAINSHAADAVESVNSYVEPRWLVEERDACGVGLIAQQQNIPSHGIVSAALKALGCLEHRGGCSADNDSGDGSGILSAIPWELFHTWMKEQNIAIPPQERTGIGMVFLPQHPADAQVVKQITEQVATAAGLTVLGWRVVPVKPEILGIQARENQPQIEQIIVSSELTGEELERQLYITRRRIGKAIAQQTQLQWSEHCYICSFSCRTIVYKGMVRAAVLGEFYQDLTNPAYQSAFCVYHRRFSTNTLPKWPLAQPMRLLGHNGEINTLLGNINWMRARQADLNHPVWQGNLDALNPIVQLDNSDSATLDNVFELLVRSGRSPSEALMLMVPEAYQNQPELAQYPEIVDFYEYFSGIQEAWDGPALLVFSDGKTVGATLDRNGLRPARYVVTKDGMLVVASEAGVVDLKESEIVEKGRLGPGQTIALDLNEGSILKNWEIKQRVAKAHPYGEWLKQYRVELGSRESVRAGLETRPYGRENGNGSSPHSSLLTPHPYSNRQTLLRHQIAFGFSSEDVEMTIQPMAAEGKEPTFCMGDDIPLAILSEKPHLLYDYFKQRFAQVTNPAIDPLRESLVMSLKVELGARGNLLDPQAEDARRLLLNSPVLQQADLEAITQSGFECATLSTQYDITTGPAGLAKAVEKLQADAVAAIKAGKQILILSDRTPNPISAETSYIPPLLAVGAVHHHSIKAGLRMKASLVVDTAQCWSTHHFACLIGYGASAVCPYLTLAAVESWHGDPKTQQMMERGKMSQLTLQQALANYQKAIEAGILKILSKMGISLLSSYQGAQIFEAIGIGHDLIALGFYGTTSRLGGLSISELASEVLSFHTRAFPEVTVKKLENFGFVQYRPGGEYHMNSPELAKALHKAVASPDNHDHYNIYKKHLQNRPLTALRDLLDFQSDRSPISIEEVEPASAIVKRFCTGGMSLGALSREAHEVLAIAMNRIGGKSNSGEGGEDPVRFKVLEDVSEGRSSLLPHLKGLKNGDTASSAIKQVASGRFGVTPEYLTNAKQIEIKIAQGAKPGEGGQLPGKKVSPYIAMLRRSKPGVTLISPPPHHDIYSIEDLVQLIFDLHQINPKAQVSVKLVAEIGIGTIAAGVAKANADIIQISGHDGGTGASPLSSIKHAGTPWELGLTEVHRSLMQNSLRDRVILRVDGGIKSGWDVLMGALMGAEEFGFGSIAMIAEGCIMARICHTNNCPVGVASQREDLRQRFPGIPEHVVNFFLFIAEETRSLLARLGYRSIDEIVGRADLLKVREEVRLTKTQTLNLDCITKLPDTKSDRAWLSHENVHSNGHVLDDEILADPEIQAAIQNQSAVSKTYNVINTDRTVGARIAGAIASLYGDDGFEGQLDLNFTGAVGQSFGAFNLSGMTLKLVGEANDYVGKGMHGGEIVITPPPEANYAAAENVIVGNTCLYGATGGVLFANGIAGERFAVRNSKGVAVIEGAGDHCCEYMTGGTIVVLGKVGRNVGAGMTGGLAYFLDEEGNFSELVNHEIVKLQQVSSPAGEQQLRQLIQAHAERTNSAKAQAILANWSDYLPKFWQVVPPSEADAPEVTVGKELSSVN
ncbi:glutamate synthase large subunit [cyanobacterium TDX16]|nr:glutamate synthase large subunit [cyanobacterium TDX16]